MTDRIIDIAERAAHLSVRNSLLVIRCGSVAAGLFRQPDDLTRPENQDGGVKPPLPAPVPVVAAVGVYPGRDRREEEEHDQNRRSQSAATKNPATEILESQPELYTIPLSDLAVVIASHPQISYTHAVLSGLAEAGAVFVTCNTKHLPVAMLLPLVTHSLQAERFAAQANLGIPSRKRIWQQIVQAQILARARLLRERTGKDWGLEPMAGRVKSGDPQNLEAQAARIYWRALFGAEFIRDREADGVNACLNYGAGVLRAIVARALCGAGLLPTLGLHHHNRYDAFCLADDLMEPFRPIVDRVVAALYERRSADMQLDKESKRLILEGLLGRFIAHDESRTLFDWTSRAASSLARVIEGESDKLDIPLL